MARLYLKKTALGSFVPADEPSAEVAKRYKAGEIYRSEIVKPRSYQNHKLAFALLTLTYQNQERYTNFEHFRKAVAIAAGHVDELITLDGEVVLQPGSLAFDALDQAEFQVVFASMMTICTKILDVAEPELAAEVSRYADDTYGRAA